MPFQAVPNSALAIIQSKLDGQDCFTTLGFSRVVPATVTTAMCQALADGLVSWVSDVFMSNLPALYIAGKIVVNALDVQDGPWAENDSLAGTAAPLGGNILPNNVTIAIAFLTGLRGRTNRGRNYWPSLTESVVSGQRVDAAFLDAIKDSYNVLIGAGTPVAGWQWSVISRKIIDGTGNGRGVPITSVIFNDNVVDSQRRRLPGRGR